MAKDVRQLNEREADSNYAPEDRRHDEVNSSASYRSYMSASVDYGKLLVANLIVINAGALLVFPTLLDKVNSGSLNVNTVTGAATMFVLGIFSAMVSGFLAYLIFMWLAHQSFTVSNKRIFLAKCTQEMRELEENKKIIGGFDSEIEKFGRWIQRSFYVGISVGILSFVFFVVGCAFVRSDVLGRHTELFTAVMKHLRWIFR